MPKLSLLICTITTRAAYLERLLKVLNPQLTPDVELLIQEDNGEISIGMKRNRLLNKATGDYVAFIDDDDLVSPIYVKSILKALEKNPDVVGFKTKRYMDGILYGWADHSLKWCKFGEHQSYGYRVFERIPNHLNPVKRNLANAVGYTNVNWGEDEQFARDIYPLLHSEVFIDEFLYVYLYRSVMHRRLEQVNAYKVQLEMEADDKYYAALEWDINTEAEFVENPELPVLDHNELPGEYDYDYEGNQNQTE